MFKRYICLIGAIFIFISFFWVVARQKSDSEGFNGRNIPEEFLLVESVQEFNAYSRLFNSGKVMAKEICFSKSLDFSGEEIVPLGNSENPFRGSIWAKPDAVLSNLKINCVLQPDGSSVGGLVAFGDGISFFDLNLENVSFDACKEATFCGVLCGRAEALVISNIMIDGIDIEESEGLVFGALAGEVTRCCNLRNVRVENSGKKHRSKKLIGKATDKTTMKNVII